LYSVVKNFVINGIGNKNATKNGLLKNFPTKYPTIEHRIEFSHRTA
jgi:hypothetical protein